MQNSSQLMQLFPQTAKQSLVSFQKGASRHHIPLKIGVVLSGGQAPGGHNVITGLYDALKKLNAESHLIGFSDGPSGILSSKWVEITQELLADYRNQGGFDLIGSGRTKIETEEQFAAAAKSVTALQLNGLVIIGGDDSNTNAALLAEYFQANQIDCRVIGVPKTIDGDLKNEYIEVSFGFDTACKIYAEIIGNIARDALSAKKYYYFLKLMGRSASHITLECALQTHPNMALISEEVEKERKSLLQIVQEIADLVVKRAEKGKHFGVILIPEGIVEFIPEFKLLIAELNALMVPDQEHAKKMESISSLADRITYIAKHLSKEALQCFRVLPSEIQAQLFLDRDPHGNVQVSKIETERLFIEMVKEELKKRRQAGSYSGKFTAQPHFCGYEGRSGMPSNFDSQYCYALGHVAALLINSGLTGYMSCVQKLTSPVETWQIAGVPLISMMQIEMRFGKQKPVIRKALVDVQGVFFKQLKQKRTEWALEDDYCYPGPIQFFGPSEITDATVFSL